MTVRLEVGAWLRAFALRGGRPAFREVQAGCELSHAEPTRRREVNPMDSMMNSGRSSAVDMPLEWVHVSGF